MSESAIEAKLADQKAKATGVRPLSHTQSVVLCAMFTVLTYVFTMIHVNPIGLPGGLVHLGNIPFFLAAVLFGKKIGAFSGGVGMALFDLLSPYAIWAPFTLVIGLATGYVVGLICQKSRRFSVFLLAMAAAAAVKIGGYYIAEALIYGNWIAPVVAIAPNFSQVVLAAILVAILLPPLRRAAEKFSLHRAS